jgi:hypothetical protein
MSTDLIEQSDSQQLSNKQRNHNQLFQEYNKQRNEAHRMMQLDAERSVIIKGVANQIHKERYGKVKIDDDLLNLRRDVKDMPMPTEPVDAKDIAKVQLAINVCYRISPQHDVEETR